LISHLTTSNGSEQIVDVAPSSSQVTQVKAQKRWNLMSRFYYRSGTELRSTISGRSGVERMDGRDVRSFARYSRCVRLSLTLSPGAGANATLLVYVSA
jgi:hypothetical protein